MDVTLFKSKVVKTMVENPATYLIVKKCSQVYELQGIPCDIRPIVSEIIANHIGLDTIIKSVCNGKYTNKNLKTVLAAYTIE